jgi:hypothetical protein
MNYTFVCSFEWVLNLGHSPCGKMRVRFEVLAAGTIDAMFSERFVPAKLYVTSQKTVILIESACMRTVLRRMFGPRRDEVTGGWRIIRIR